MKFRNTEYINLIVKYRKKLNSFLYYSTNNKQKLKTKEKKEGDTAVENIIQF